MRNTLIMMHACMPKSPTTKATDSMKIAATVQVHLMHCKIKKSNRSKPFRHVYSQNLKHLHTIKVKTYFALNLNSAKSTKSLTVGNKHSFVDFIIHYICPEDEAVLSIMCVIIIKVNCYGVLQSRH